MGPPNRLDRVVQCLMALVALLMLANGVEMLAMPAAWYHRMPTVPHTGPLNGHFVQDIGLAFGCSGLLILYAAIDPRGRWQAALAGVLWPGAHALLHVVDGVRGTRPRRCSGRTRPPCSARRCWC